MFKMDLAFLRQGISGWCLQVSQSPFQLLKSMSCSHFNVFNKSTLHVELLNLPNIKHAFHYCDFRAFASPKVIVPITADTIKVVCMINNCDA